MNLEEKCVNTIKGLAIDAVEQANSGHPGMPMGAADIAFVLWSKFLNHTPSQPDWANRDRFILSAGHSSALLYAFLHLTGYDVSLNDLRDFRQLGSKTPGHPEYWCIPGVEATTGQLGQGFAMGVGMAIAERVLAARFNTEKYALVDHWTYAIVSDGDLMEGVSSEAASLAGHLKLGKLIYLYDDNHITIEGSTELAFSENVTDRFKAYGWDVNRVDGHNREEIEKAILRAQADAKPSLIACRTTIAKGSPNKEGSASSHGSPLGKEEAALTKANLGLPPDSPFFVDKGVREFFAERKAQLEKAYDVWRESEKQYIKELPEPGRNWRDAISGKLPDGFEKLLPQFEAGESLATRSCLGKALNAITEAIPSLIGGSADLSPSTKTTIDKSGDISPDSFAGQNIHFGVREHAMGAVLNGLALHKGVIPFGATFFVFSDYMRPAIRLSAMMKLRVIYVFTHDSIFVGEDGPTHQPIEQLMSLRLIPGLTVIRPADGNETAQALASALRNTDGPTAILLTRQKVAALSASKDTNGVELGAYEVVPQSNPDVVIIATGSEVSLAVDAAEELARTHKKSARVVSMPSWELFEKQPAPYKDHLLPPDVLKVAIEAGRTQGWERFVGDRGLTLGIDEFGLSGNSKDLSERFGLTVSAVVEKITDLLL